MILRPRRKVWKVPCHDIEILWMILIKVEMSTWHTSRILKKDIWTDSTRPTKAKTAVQMIHYCSCILSRDIVMEMITKVKSAAFKVVYRSIPDFQYLALIIFNLTVYFWSKDSSDIHYKYPWQTWCSRCVSRWRCTRWGWPGPRTRGTRRPPGGCCSTRDFSRI